MSLYGQTLHPYSICSYQDQEVRGRGKYARGHSYYGDTTKQKGLFSVLGIHIFDFGQKAPADQIRTSWKNLVQHVGKIHGHDIINELLNKRTVIIPKPDHTQNELDKHKLAVEIKDQLNQRLAEARKL